MPLPKLTPTQWQANAPQALKRAPHWVGHQKKVPSHPTTRRLARVNDPSTWGTFKEVVGYLEETAADPEAGAGFVFTEADEVVAIDLDHMVEATITGTGEVQIRWLLGSEPVQELLRTAPLGRSGYAEVSPSGTGVHIFIRGRLPAGVNHKRVLDEASGMKLEVWDSRRYVTITGVRLPGCGDIAPNPPLLAAVVDFVGVHDPHQASSGAEPERAEEISRALVFLDPDMPYESWIRAGMALKAGLGVAGRQLWLEWSRRGQKHVPGEPEAKWDSFAGSGVGLGTLVRMAEEAGWEGPPRQTAKEAFAEFVEPGPSPPASDKPPAPESSLRIVPAAQVQIVDPEWLWRGRIAVGELGLLVGDPGIGKSLVSVDISARLTRGLPLPGETRGRRPARVLYLNAEDHPAQTTRVRIEAAGADIERLYILDVGSRQVRLPSDVGALDELLRRYGDVDFLTLDPLVAVLDQGLDSNSMTDVRRATDPLAQLGARRRISPFVNHHFTKSLERTGIYRVAGSVGIVGATRHVLVMSLDPDEDEGSPVRNIGVLKTNAALVPTLSLRIAERRIAGVTDPVAVVEWTGTSSVSAARLTEAPARKNAPKREDATLWLAQRMDSGEEVPARLIFEEGSAHGYGEQTLRRAAAALGIEHRSLGARGTLWKKA